MLPGDVFGKYQVLAQIASGGMAEVWLARSSSIGGFEKQLAIKRMRSDLSGNARFISMFIDEARLTVSLNHPNIVQVFDFGRVEDDYFMAMEFVDGIDLAHMAHRARRMGTRIPVPMSLLIMNGVFEALAYAHTRKGPFGENSGIIHRDVSPQNILVSFDGHVKVSDFGIAKAMASVDVQDQGQAFGKLAYVSPEQLYGLPVGTSTDIWSAGVILHELLSNRRLFARSTDEETQDAVEAGEIPPPSNENPEVPPEVDTLVARILDRRADERPSNAREIAEALGRTLAHRFPEANAFRLAEAVSTLCERRPLSVLPPPSPSAPGLDPHVSLDAPDEHAAPRRPRDGASSSASLGATPPHGLQTRDEGHASREDAPGRRTSSGDTVTLGAKTEQDLLLLSHARRPKVDEDGESGRPKEQTVQTAQKDRAHKPDNANEADSADNADEADHGDQGEHLETIEHGMPRGETPSSKGVRAIRQPSMTPTSKRAPESSLTAAHLTRENTEVELDPEIAVGPAPAPSEAPETSATGESSVARLKQRFLEGPNLWTFLEIGRAYKRLGDTKKAILVHKLAAAKFAQRGLLVQAACIYRELIEAIEPSLVRDEIKRLRVLQGVPDEPLYEALRATNDSIDLEELRALLEVGGTRNGSQKLAEIFVESPILSRLSADHFAQFVEAIHLRRFDTGDVIIEEGDVGDSFFMIGRGRVIVSSRDYSGRRTYLTSLSDSDCFGEQAFFTGGPRNATVEALEPVLLLETTREVLGRLIEEFPTVGESLRHFYRDRVAQSLLTKSEIFGHLTTRARQAFAQRFRFESFARDEFILREGEISDSFYAIKSGGVRVLTGSGDTTTVLANLGPGEIFGEAAAIDGSPRTASVQTTMPSELLSMSGEELNKLLADNSDVRSLLKDKIEERRKNRIALSAPQEMSVETAAPAKKPS